MKQQRGFTLIELIVVIVILGILAATALPKFSGLSADARAAKMQGIAASIRAASSMAHGQALAEQATSVTSVSLEDGTPVTMFGYYPRSGVNGIIAALDLDTSVSYVASGLGTAISFDANRPACAILYHPAPSTTAPASVTTVAITGSANIAANCI